MIKMKKEENNNIVVAAHQAPNWNNPHKWTESKMLLEGIKTEYRLLIERRSKTMESLFSFFEDYIVVEMIAICQVQFSEPT